MKPSRKIPKKDKAALIAEAGGKCANPGCPTIRVEYHHIKEWSVVRSHNQKDMIAICPTCHDAAHHGALKITEKTLYEWKGIARESNKLRTNIYVEPGEASKVLLGSVAFAQKEPRKTTIFSISPEQYLEFEVKDDFLSISTQVLDKDGNPLVRVTNNNITAHATDTIKIEKPNPGRFRMTAPASLNLLPAYALVKMRLLDEGFAKDDVVTILDVNVLKPGLVKVEGFWRIGNITVVSSNEHLAFVDLHKERPSSFSGDGENSVFLYTGPIDQALFSFR